MLFNSQVFLLFLAIVVPAYFLARRNLRLQNSLLLLASYVFYGWWDWRFLGLLAFTTVLDFTVARQLGSTTDLRHRRWLLGISIVSNMAILGFFKYFNFFASSTVAMLAKVGIAADPLTLQVILPVGISFYTFQSMSYTIDVYRRHLEPSRNLFDFALFLSFFPQLVAGPIERATHLLPQIQRARVFDLAAINAGLWLILWGYFKKVVIADRMAIVANGIFDNYMQHSGLNLVIGALAFTVQIYCDFSAYSDIARGIAKCLGFDLMLNFRLPYFAINPSDFWQRWHISLSTWLRDYLYIPLGGNRRGPVRTQVNLMITMLLGGLWHGAAWNFVIWGGYHGLLLAAYRVFDRPVDPSRRHGHVWRRGMFLGKMALMFLFTVIGWIIFRARSTEQIVHFLTQWGWSLSDDSLRLGYDWLFYTWPLVVVQLWQHAKGDLLAPMRVALPWRVLLYSLLLSGIFIFGVRQGSEFIYFQF